MSGGNLTYTWTTPAEYTIGSMTAQNPWNALRSGTLAQRNAYSPMDDDWWYVTSGPQLNTLWLYQDGVGWRYVLQGSSLADVQAIIGTGTSPAQTLDVAKSGTVYTSVATALSTISDASSTKPYVVRIFPGIYDEPPFTIPAYVTVWALAPWGMVVVRTTDLTNHFITGGSNSALRNLALVGPTTVGKAAIHYAGNGFPPFFVDNVEIRQGYYGILVDPVSFGTVHGHQVVNRDTSVAVENFIRVEGGGGFIGIQCSWMNWSPVGSNVGYYASGASAFIFLSQCTFLTSVTSDGVYLDNGATVELNGCAVSSSGVAGVGIHIGPTGASSFTANSTTIQGGFTYDLKVDSPTAMLVFGGSADDTKFSFTPGSTISVAASTPSGFHNHGLVKASDGGVGHATSMDGTTGTVHADTALEVPVIRRSNIGVTAATIQNDGSIDFAGPLRSTDPIYVGGLPVRLGTPTNTFDVATSGMPYSSVRTAVLAANAVASASSPQTVRVFPGTYTEAPFTIGQYVSVVSEGDWITVIIQTNDLTRHFISMESGSYLYGVTLLGPTDPGQATIRGLVGFAPSLVDHCIISQGYYGVLSDPLTYGSMNLQNVISSYQVGNFQKFIYATNFGNINHQLCSSVVVNPAPVPATAAVFAAEGPNALLNGDVASVLSYQQIDAAFVDDSATMKFNASTFRKVGAAVGNALHVGGTGTSFLSCNGGSIRGNWLWDGLIDTSAAMVRINSGGRKDYFSYPLGMTSISGTIYDPTPGAGGVRVLGEIWVSENEIPLVEYTDGRRSAGIVSGFEVSRHAPGSTRIDVATGLGYVANVLNQIVRVPYAGGFKVLTPNKDYIWLSIDETGTLNETFSQPDGTRNILVTTAATDATSVTILSPNRVPLPMPDISLWQYNTDVIGVKNVSGGLVTQNVTPLMLDVQDSTYYTHYDIIASTGGVGVTFVGWYRDPMTPGAWIKVPGMTLVDDEQYDAAGLGLQPIPPGEYARHTLYVSKSDVLTTYHMVYGQQTWPAPATNANLDPAPPEILDKETALLAGLIVQKSAGTIELIIDDRQRLNRSVAGITITPTNDHNALINLTVGNPHTQYQLRSEKGAIGGYCGLDGSAKVAVTNLNTATLTGTTVAVGASAIGAGPKLAFEDHGHSLSVDGVHNLTPGQANNPGTATSAARSDHDHALPAFGTGAGTFCQGNDSRLTSDRTASGLRTATTVVSISGSAAPAAGDMLVATSSTAAIWSDGPFTFLGPLTLEDASDRTLTLNPIHGVLGNVYLQVTATGSDGKVLSVSDGVNEVFYTGTTAGGLSSFTYSLKVGDWFSGGLILPNAPLSAFHNVNSYAQVNLQNVSSGPLASSDYVATADDGDDTHYFLDLAIAGSTFADPAYTLFGPHDVWLAASDNKLFLGCETDNVANAIVFFTRGTLAGCERMRLTNAGRLGIGLINPAYLLDVNGSGNFTSLFVNTVAVVTTDDARLTNSRTPTAHASTHAAGGLGGDGLGTAAPAATGVATASAEGSATTFARSDHAHQSNTSPAVVTKAAAVIGVSGEPARADHKHDVSTATAGAATPGDSAAEGGATSMARSDHRHSLPAFGTGLGTFCQGNDGRLSDSRTPTAHASTHAAGGLGGDGLGTAAPAATGVASVSAEGSATTFARSDHAHQSNTAPSNVTKATASVGSSGEPARADHKHDITTAAPGATGVATTSGEGAASSLARSDHSHQSNTTASTLGTANSIGTSGEPARADHVHAHGNQTVGTLHAAVTATVNGFAPAMADGTVLVGAAAGPTALAAGTSDTFLGGDGTRVVARTATQTTASLNTVTAALKGLSPAIARGTILAGSAGGPTALTANTANTFLGGDGTDVSARTAAQVTASLNLATNALQGLVPALGNNVLPIGQTTGNVTTVTAGSTGLSVLQAANQTTLTGYINTVTASLSGAAPAMADGTVLVGAAGGPTALAAGTANTFLGGDGTRVVARTAAQTTASLNAVSNTAQGVAVAVGGVGTVLTSTGTAATWQTPSAGGIFGSQSQFTVDGSGSGSSATDAATGTSLTATAMPAGTYRVAYHGELTISSNNILIGMSLYNSTDAVSLCDGDNRSGSAASIAYSFDGFAFVTFTAGQTKTFIVRYHSNGSVTVNWAHVRIEFYRVS
jgi:hypothetical protein